MRQIATASCRCPCRPAMALLRLRSGRATAKSANAPWLRAMERDANSIVRRIVRLASSPDRVPNFAATASCRLPCLRAMERVKQPVARVMANPGPRCSVRVTASSRAMRIARVTANVPAMPISLAMANPGVKPTGPEMARSRRMSHAPTALLAVKPAATVRAPKVVPAMARRIPSVAKPLAASVLQATPRARMANRAAPIPKAKHV